MFSVYQSRYFYLSKLVFMPSYNYVYNREIIKKMLTKTPYRIYAVQEFDLSFKLVGILSSKHIKLLTQPRQNENLSNLGLSYYIVIFDTPSCSM